MEKRTIPDLYIEQLYLDELPEQEKKALLQDSHTSERLAALERSNEQILQSYDPEDMVKAITESLQKREWDRNHSFRNFRGRILPAAGIAAILVIAVSIALINRPGIPYQAADTTRIKGIRPHLVVYKKTANGVEVLEENAVLNEKDVLQISYISGGIKYGVIFSIDGRGTITLHYPLTTASSFDLEKSGETPLTFAYKLDDAPSFERFFFVTSDHKFSVDEVLSRAQVLSRYPVKARLNDLELPDVFEQTSILFSKEINY